MDNISEKIEIIGDRGDFLTPECFSIEVEKLATTTPDLTLLDAVQDVCEKYGIEVEDVSKFISKPLYAELYADALHKNLLNDKDTTQKLF